jgi:hypothetical protein
MIYKHSKEVNKVVTFAYYLTLPSLNSRKWHDDMQTTSYRAHKYVDFNAQ